jgi:glucosamine-6-phosphate deaminase
MWTNVERAFLSLSGRKESYPIEKVPVIEVQNVYTLGKIVVLSFLEWVEANPNGVIALPTGKTPEYFIKTLDRYKKGWDNPDIRAEVVSYGYTGAHFPDTSQLKFVMLDEFFPILPTHRNSFCNYIKSFYISTLNIPNENILTFDLIANNVISVDEMKAYTGHVDLSLLERDPLDSNETIKKDILMRVKQFCDDYEKRVREWGGIGFFLGGIGPDGHIAFNQEGSRHDSTTRFHYSFS